MCSVIAKKHKLSSARAPERLIAPRHLIGKKSVVERILGAYSLRRIPAQQALSGHDTNRLHARSNGAGHQAILVNRRAPGIAARTDNQINAQLCTTEPYRRP
jgi:hypothetical protein